MRRCVRLSKFQVYVHRHSSVCAHDLNVRVLEEVVDFLLPLPSSRGNPSFFSSFLSF